MVTMGDNRVVVLVDMDCFYCQVEAKLNPSYIGKPLAVVQYNDWRGGGIIAVNYEARDKGVKRGMRGDQARKLCPDIILAKVAEVRGKADLTKYRDAGKEVVKVFHDFSDCIERASIDEAYIDITKSVDKRLQEITESETGIFPSQLSSTFIIGFTEEKSNDEEMRAAGLETWLESLSEPNRLRLAVGALIVEEMRAAVFQRTSFRCSAGISHNKILAKLVCGIHKPNRQTVLPPDQVEHFFSSLPIQKVRNLGGKFGTEVVERLGCQTMGDLARFSLRDLQKHYDEKNGAWLYNIARGIDNDAVTVRLIPKSIGCSKNFPGKTALATKHDVEHWMRELVSELVVRLSEDQEENKRRAQLLTVMVTQDTDVNSSGSTSRSGPLPGYNVDRIVSSALTLIAKTNSASASSDAWCPPLKHISFSAGKFVEDSSLRNTSIQTFFKHVDKGETSTMQDLSEEESSRNEFASSLHTSGFLSSKADIEEMETLPNICDGSFNSRCDINASNGSTSSILNHFKAEKKVVDISYKEPLNHDNEQESTLSEAREFDKSSSERSKLEKESSFHLSSKVSKNSPPAVCPEDLESAVYHSFFAKYIVQMKKSDKSQDQNQGVHSVQKLPEVSPPCTTSTLADATTESTVEDSEKCGECGQMVLLQDFPEHVDYHSALKLQQELNDNPTPPEGALDRNNINPPSAVPSCSLDGDNSNDNLLEKCSYCSKLIPLDEFPEHIDYHSALQLQRELNQINNVSHPSTSSSHANNIPVLAKKKRGRPGKQGPSPLKKVRSNNIASFFVPK